MVQVIVLKNRTGKDGVRNKIRWAIKTLGGERHKTASHRGESLRSPQKGQKAASGTNLHVRTKFWPT